MLLDGPAGLKTRGRGLAVGGGEPGRNDGKGLDAASESEKFEQDLLLCLAWA